jgi:hypothetical protein
MIKGLVQGMMPFFSGKFRYSDGGEGELRDEMDKETVYQRVQARISSRRSAFVAHDRATSFFDVQSLAGALIF